MRVIQIGLGRAGRKWAEIVRDAAGVELVAVADPELETRRWASDKLGLAAEGCHESLGEALSRTDCEAVLVITPPETHHALVTEALEAGKHVLVEKPLETSLLGARSLVDTAAQHNRILLVNQNYRFTQPARAIQRLVAEGTLGRLIGVKVSCKRNFYSLLSPGDFRYLMRHPYVLDMAIHHFDLLRALTGQEVRQIYSRSWIVPDSPFRYDPAMVAVMTLESGATVSYEGDWANRGPETSWNGEWELIGEAGRLHWIGDKDDRNVGEVTLELWGEPPYLAEQPQLPSVERTAVLQALRVAIESGKQSEISAADNINSLAVTMGCAQSIDTGALVNVADLLDT